jgi:hypothetical protein
MAMNDEAKRRPAHGGYPGPRREDARPGPMLVDSRNYRLGEVVEVGPGEIVVNLAAHEIEKIEAVYFTPDQELGDWCTHLTFIQNASGGEDDAPWPDEFMDWYKPSEWLGVHRAACVFIAKKLRGERDAAVLAMAEAERIRQVINTPELQDFARGAALEAAHQRERWGSDHDGGKEPEDWFWLVGYLCGKALAALKSGDADKALHHTISTAAALANWHAAVRGTHTGMRPGIEPPIEAEVQTCAPEGGA